MIFFRNFVSKKQKKKKEKVLFFYGWPKRIGYITGYCDTQPKLFVRYVKEPNISQRVRASVSFLGDQIRTNGLGHYYFLSNDNSIRNDA